MSDRITPHTIMLMSKGQRAQFEQKQLEQKQQTESPLKDPIVRKRFIGSEIGQEFIRQLVCRKHRLLEGATSRLSDEAKDRENVLAMARIDELSRLINALRNPGEEETYFTN